MSELARAVVRIEGDIADLQAALQLANEEMNKAGKTFQDIGEQMFLKITLPLSTIGGLAVKEFGESADAVAKVNAVLAATGNISGQTTDGILALAASLEKTTRFSETSVVAAAGLLATFQQVRNEAGAGNDVFDRTIKVAADLSSVMGTDLTNATRALGRALEDPTTGLMLLRRAGIQFNVDEQFQIKTLVAHGQILEAQRMILDKVASKTRDAAKALAETPLGHFTQMWNALKESLQSVGSIMVKVLVPLADMVKALAEDFRALPVSVQTVIVVVAALAAGIGPLLIVIAQLSKVFAFIRAFSLLGGAASGVATVFGGLKVALLALVSPLGLLTIGLTVLTIGWLKAEAAAEATRKASQAATDQMIAGFAQLSPEQVQRRVARITEVMTQWQAQVDALKASIQAAPSPDISAPISDVPDMSGPMPDKEMDAKRARLQALQEQIDRFKAALDALKALNTGVDAASRTNEQFAAAVKASDLKLKEATASAQGLGQVMGPTFSTSTEVAAALQAHLKEMADNMAKAGKSAAQIAVELRAEGQAWQAANLEAGIDGAAVALKNAQMQAQVLGVILGPTFSESGANAAALRAQIDTTVTAMVLMRKPIADIIAAVKELGAQWQTANLQAGIDAANLAFKNASTSAQVLANILGPSFSQADANAAAFRAQIDATVTEMTNAKKSVEEITAATKALGAQWQAADLAAHISDATRELNNATEQAQVLGKIFGPTFNVANAEADALRSHIQAVVTAMVAAGKAPDEIIAKVHDLGNELQELEAKAKIGDFLIDQFGRASDAIVDFAFGAQKSIGDFIRQALMDFAKLILRIELMKLVMGIGGGVGSGGGGTFGVDSAGGGDVSFAASGGSFPAGAPVVVGEAGPELVRAGRTGMTVAPMSRVSDGGGERLTVPVTVNVQTIDSKSTAQFFEENQGIVAATVLKAVQRSRLLRNGLS